jgi:hypothetical protein
MVDFSAETQALYRARREANAKVLERLGVAVPKPDFFVLRHHAEAEALQRLGIACVAIGNGSASDAAALRHSLPARGSVVVLVDQAGGSVLRDDLHAAGLVVRGVPAPYGHGSIVEWVRHFEAANIGPSIARDCWFDHVEDHALEEERFGARSQHPYSVAGACGSAVASVWGSFDHNRLQQPPPPRRYLLSHPDGDGLLAAGKVGLLASEGGCGKTMVLCQLAVAVALGTDWLAHFSVGSDAVGGRVLLALAEEDAEEAHRRLWAVLQSMEATERQRKTVAERVVVLPLAGHAVALLRSDAAGNTEETAELDRLRRLLHEHAGDGWALIALDPL